MEMAEGQDLKAYLPSKTSRMGGEGSAIEYTKFTNQVYRPSRKCQKKMFDVKKYFFNINFSSSNSWLEIPTDIKGS